MLVVATGMLTALLLAGLAWLVARPERLLRWEFARQRRRAHLQACALDIAGHRWAAACSAGAMSRDGVPVAPSQAPVLVMIHGFTGGKENFFPLARALHGSGATLWLPDLPGWGDSTRVPGADYGYAAQAERVAAFIARVSPTRPVLLLGHSMGGAIAVLVAARYPSCVAALALLAPAGAPFTANAFALDTLAGGHPFAVHDAASLRRYLRLLFPERSTRPWAPWPASAAYIRRRRNDDAFEREVSAAMAGPDRFLPEAEAERIHVPVRLLWGQDDPIIAADAAHAYAAKMPQASVMMLPGGHMVLMERPQAVAEALQPMLAAVQSATLAGTA
jgi:pimeloyl-ACP methyl ester carboxylesterase